MTWADLNEWLQWGAIFMLLWSGHKIFDVLTYLLLDRREERRKALGLDKHYP